MPPTPEYVVTVHYLGMTEITTDKYGPFSTEDAAEACCIALAGRSDVRRCTIEKNTI